MYYHGKNDWWDESDWRSKVPVARQFAKRNQAERDEKKAKQKQAKSKENQAKEEAKAQKAQAEYEAYMADLEKRQALQLERESQAEAARKFERETRDRIGMDTSSLDTLYNTQQQLAEEQVSNFQENVDITQQGGVADVKFPWKTTLAFLAIAGGIYYYRS